MSLTWSFLNPSQDPSLNESIRSLSISLESSLNSLLTGLINPIFIAQLHQAIRDAEIHDRISIRLAISDQHPSFEDLQACLATVYVEAEKEKASAMKFLVQVDVLIDGFSQSARKSLSDSGANRPVRTVALGGTFDHLHSGHKILLTMAAWLATYKLIIGITDEVLLVNKKFAHRLQSLEERTASVVSFLRRVGPSDLLIDTPALKDIYGPTATEPDIQAILVSKETISGADSINKTRTELGLEPLQQYVIDVISSHSASLRDVDVKDLKMSSTEIRRWLESEGKGMCR